ncbi:MAG TPA: HAD family hydrolase [Candidatus Dormibacteraeota bacterium]|nr:HAD family hydrolase [Candidatus Dormibacteraeota bacterium]
MPAVRVLGFDGDDTLWHSEIRFHVTQGEFRDLLKGHAPEADVDKLLAETEMKNLSIYGYGIKSFTLSMLETAIEITQRRIPTEDIQVILGWGKRMLTEPTKLLEGVEHTLRTLAGRYDMVLITKGDLFDQESKLAQSGLGDLFHGVEILSEKNAGSYRGVFKRRGIKPEDFVMVGNSLRSDVVPVVSLGGRAVHIPYQVTWEHEQVPEDELPKEGWKRISSITELPATLDALHAAGAST